VQILTALLLLAWLPVANLASFEEESLARLAGSLALSEAGEQGSGEAESDRWSGPDEDPDDAAPGFSRSQLGLLPTEAAGRDRPEAVRLPYLPGALRATGPPRV
jgi:hypothetical protein